MRFLRRIAQPFLDPRGALEGLLGMANPELPQLPEVSQAVRDAENTTAKPMQTAADPARKNRMGRRGLRIAPEVAQSVSGTRSGLSIPGA